MDRSQTSLRNVGRDHLLSVVVRAPLPRAAHLPLAVPLPPVAVRPRAGAHPRQEARFQREVPLRREVRPARPPLVAPLPPQEQLVAPPPPVVLPLLQVHLLNNYMHPGLS